MSSNSVRAEEMVKAQYPDAKAVDSFAYKDVYLVRVEHPDPEESNYDPFFSANLATGEVKPFSIGTDGDPAEVAKAYNNRG